MFRIANIKKNILMLSAMLIGLSFLPLQAQTQSELFQELTEVKLSGVVPVLEKLEATGDEVLITLFQNLAEGNLYYNEENLELVTVVKVEGEDVITNLLFGDVLDIDKKSTSKIRVNNKIRIYLRGAIARIQLNSDDADTRREAVRSLFAKMDPTTLATITELRETELNKKVQDAMDIVIFMDTAENSTDSTLRVFVINQ
jgi:urea transport system permease protein